MVIIEEDLDVSVDILTYFNQLLPVLENDESVYCISAWNDQVCSVNIVVHACSFLVLNLTQKGAGVTIQSLPFPCTAIF